MADINYTPDYEDERFSKIESDKNQALTEHEQLYSGMVGNVDEFYNKQIEASQQWADKQSQLQQEQTDFAIEQIEQQKDKAHKDYLKEQSGAYVDWQKQSNAYGTEAEKMASSGLTNTGFSESSQVSMYNTYQNRVATAREVFAQATLNYDNAMKDARLQNSAVLAEIAANAYKEQLELSLQGFQYKNDLILEQANKKLEIENAYYNRYLDVLNQINTENAMAEEVRQFNESQKFTAEQNRLNREFEAQQAEITRAYQAEQAELDRKHELALQEAKTKAEKELLDKQHKQAMEKLAQQHKNDLALLERERALAQASKSSGGGGSSGGGSSSGGSINYSGKISGGGTASKLPVNTDSVIALGYGPISGDRLSQLVAEGKVEVYEKNGQLYARKAGTKSASDLDAKLKKQKTPGAMLSTTASSPKTTTKTKTYTPGTATSYGGQGGTTATPERTLKKPGWYLK